MSWEGFSRELRLAILETFCAELIEKFERLPNEIGANFPWKYFDIEYNELNKWPPGPESLKDFMAAITTCREFHHIITHAIKFN
jgi:hypothetical protein